MMPNFYMTVGIAGSGKSWIYENEIKKLHAANPDYYSEIVYVSSDAIREEVFGDVNDQTHNAEVFNIMHARSVAALKEGKSVYYDATNLSAKRRMAFLRSIDFIPNVYKSCILNVPPFELVKERNASRYRQVPEFVLERMLRQFEMPDISEGWNQIRVFGVDRFVDSENEKILQKMVVDALNLSHDNPHHSNSVGGHMVEAWSYAVKHRFGTIVRNAAFYHDIGKPYCKVFHNMKNEPTEFAHYYNHENVGAYLYISMSPGMATDIVTANLIAHHMDYFKGESYFKKVRARYPEEFIKLLDQLHECDLAAH